MDSHFAWLPLLAEKNLAYAFLIAAILVATLTMLLRLYRYQNRQKRGGSALPTRQQVRPDPREKNASTPDCVVRWEVEMQELARDLKAEIDSKMIALGHLIHDADRAAERLERALMNAPSHDEDPAEDRQDFEPSVLENGALRDEVYQLSDYGFSIHDIASRLTTPAGQIELILRLREEKG